MLGADATASDGEQAIAHLTDLGPSIDLLISDVVLPRRSVNEVIAHTKNLAPKTRIILITGYLDEQHSLGDDVLTVLWKPFSMMSSGSKLMPPPDAEGAERCLGAQLAVSVQNCRALADPRYLMSHFKRNQRKYVKKAYRVRNWHEYEATRRNRGSLTVWISLTDGV